MAENDLPKTIGGKGICGGQGRSGLSKAMNFLSIIFNMADTATPKIFYQSSMPRAGSTLLQNILAQNPDFYVTPTSGLLELIFGARLNYTNSAEFKAQDSVAMKKAFLAFSRAGMEAYFEALTDK